MAVASPLSERRPVDPAFCRPPFPLPNDTQMTPSKFAEKAGAALPPRHGAFKSTMQRSAGNTALDQRDPQRMVNLASPSQLLREAAEAFVPTAVGETTLARGGKGSG